MHNTAEKKTLILCEVFYPEDFLINDLVKIWEQQGRNLEVLTRVPSYPFGKVFSGYKNKIYQTSFYGQTKVHRIPVWQGYQNSTLIKVLNYLSFVFWSFWVILFIGHRFDKVFIYQTGPLTLATAGILMKKIYGTKVILWTQDLWPDSVFAFGFKKNKILTFCLDCFVKWIYKNSDEILMSCEGFEKSIKSYVPWQNPIFIPNWSLIQHCPTNKITLPGEFNFTFAGNIGTVQNLDNVVRGFKLFVKEYPKVWLNIIGDGSYMSKLQMLVKEENIPNVNFTGRKPLQEMPNYYEASDVLLLSLKDVPLYEIMIPSKFQTYLPTGKPIYAIFKGETRNIVEKYHIGIGANPNAVGNIAKGFEQLVNLSKEECSEMSKNAIKLSKTIFDKSKIIDRINSLLW